MPKSFATLASKEMNDSLFANVLERFNIKD
jgi:hypothetical protein